VDIVIHPEILRRRQLLAWSRGVLIAATVIALLMFVRQLITPSIERRDIRTAIVERGAISTEVQAAGTVVPKTERVLISPITSSIHEVYQPLGSSVKKGDPILKVNSEQVELEISRLNDELLLKDLEIKGLLQQQQKQLRELHNRQELAGIDLQNQKIIVDRYETLYQSNIVSKFDFETAGLNARKTELQLQQLAQQIADTLESDSNQLEQREVEKQILLQKLMEQEKIHNDTTVRASADGIITVLMNQLGQNVMAGSELARISDLSSFRIDATLSDYYLHQISVGMPVNIDLGNDSITGVLSQILPSVDNGIIGLQIELDNPRNEKLKPNQRVEAGILTQQRDSGLRVTNGVVFNGAGLQEIFVVQDTRAVKKKIEAGLQNSSYVEIVSGLQEGDEVIISDISDYVHLEEVAVTD
jgi:HlyD family secretion protein